MFVSLVSITTTHDGNLFSHNACEAFPEFVAGVRGLPLRGTANQAKRGHSSSVLYCVFVLFWSFMLTSFLLGQSQKLNLLQTSHSYFQLDVIWKAPYLLKTYFFIF